MGQLHKVLFASVIFIFVSLSVKAVHIEAVSDLTSEACLRSDHGTNFVGILKELKNTNNGITWDFIPER